MTVSHLKKSMDARFRWVDTRFRAIDRRFERIDRRFERIDRRFEQIDRRFEDVNQRFEDVNRRFDELRVEIREGEERTRRHFDVVAESLHDDMRIFAEAIGIQSERLGDHETRLRRLEQRRS